MKSFSGKLTGEHQSEEIRENALQEADRIIIQTEGPANTNIMKQKCV